jgi:dCMP deaminase
MIRRSKAEWLMSLAIETSTMATCNRLQVGAVLVQDDAVIGTGYNGAPRGLPHCDCTPDRPCEVSVHAELNVVANAAKNGHATAGSTLYITHAPCRGCAGVLVNAGLDKVYYRLNYRSYEGLELLRQAGLQVGTA